MQLQVTDDAMQWYRRELSLAPGDAVHLFVRYGGESNLHPGFSIGITREHIPHPGLSTTLEDIEFAITDEDLWYFQESDVWVVYNAETDEVEYVLGERVES